MITTHEPKLYIITHTLTRGGGVAQLVENETHQEVVGTSHRRLRVVGLSKGLHPHMYVYPYD